MGITGDKRKNGNGVMCTGGVVMFRHTPHHHKNTNNLLRHFTLTNLTNSTQFYGTYGVQPNPSQPEKQDDLSNSILKFPTPKPEKIQHKTPQTHSQSRKQTTTTNR